VRGKTNPAIRPLTRPWATLSPPGREKSKQLVLVDQNSLMELKTYRAATMHEALELVRHELGPDAAVLHTREVRGTGLAGLFRRARQIEVTASSGVNVPSRLPPVSQEAPSQGNADPNAVSGLDLEHVAPPPAHLDQDYRRKFREDLKGQIDNLQSMVEQLCRESAASIQNDLPPALFHVFTDMIEADVSEDTARQLIEHVRDGSAAQELTDPMMVKVRIARMIEDQIEQHGPIRAAAGKRRLVALVGPTGVGKTTTIAKLAANYRLREGLRVGLITVDTYRIAAVEQLRTYADIIDLPMEVVSTPREMREAVARLQDLDLVLMDTAGRSPRDDVRIQELKSMLAEADADEVHLVLSSVSGPANLAATYEKFAAAGTTALILTKLDESAGLGNLLSLFQSCRLPLSYLTNGQNVPDDIAIADRRWLARNMLGMES